MSPDELAKSQSVKTPLQYARGGQTGYSRGSWSWPPVTSGARPILYFPSRLITGVRMIPGLRRLTDRPWQACSFPRFLQPTRPTTFVFERLCTYCLRHKLYHDSFVAATPIL
jgi:hypothetical protein